MRTRFACWLAVALAVVTSVDAANDICATKGSCTKFNGARTCKRDTDPSCPPCLYLSSGGKLECYDVDALTNQCPPGTTYCPSSTPSKSSSGSGSGPAPTTTAPPTTEPPTTAPVSDSGSGSSTPKPSKTTPKPTTKAPKTPAPTTEEPTLSPSNVTEAPQATSEPVDTTSKSGSSSKLPLIVGIAGAVVIVLAVIAFFVWKRNRDDDDDSDDDDFRFKNPPATYNARGGGAGGAAAFNANNVNRAVTSPVSRMGKYATGGAAATAGNYGAAKYGGAQSNTAPAYGGGAKYAGATEYSSGGMYGAQYAAAGVDYGSPSGIDGDHRALYTGPGGVAIDSRDSLGDSLSGSEDTRDVWGNAIQESKAENSGARNRAVPTARTVEADRRGNRTLSNVSIEF